MERPEWLKKYNIIAQDVIILAVWFIGVMLILFFVLTYPVACMIRNKDEINAEIKDIWQLVRGKYD